MKTRIGFGYDVHQLVADRELWLCGVKLQHEKGLLGHSDADVALHALCDALLGAAALGDIGKHFPPSDNRYKGIDSKILLARCVAMIRVSGYEIGNVDMTICAERPKINPHIAEMRECVARVMQIPQEDVSIKATTTEKLGFTGREEGISAYAVALIERR